MSSDPLPVVEMRQLAFRVAVLHDVDLHPADDGIVLHVATDVTVPWPTVVAELGDVDPATPLAAARLGRLLRDLRAASNLGPEELRVRARPVGLPPHSPHHPGDAWVCARVLGGSIDLGLGFLGAHDAPDAVELLAPAALEAAGIDASTWWPQAQRYLEQMGTIAARRLVENPPPTGRQAALRPIGDADVITLLGSAALRRALAARDGTGMCAVAVPMRRRGWIDLRSLDPAFIPAAAAVTDAADRGFSCPLLVTADEVVARTT